MSTLVQSAGSIVDRSRWRAFCVLCLGLLMMVIDAMVVTVALPSIRADLGFSQLSLTWVVNAYLITYSGFLLIGGRLGDLLGRRRLFLFGIALFTVASTACGLANSPLLLIAGRAIQGLGAAVVAAVVLALVANLFPEGPERARAMGIYNFVTGFGCSLGLLLGGALTGLLSWHWIFLINLPLGVVVYALGVALLPGSPRPREQEQLDIAGAVAGTATVMLAAYAIADAGNVGWNSVQTATCLSGAAGSLTLFLYIESRVPSPLIPLGLFRQRTFIVINTIFVLWNFTVSAWYFISTLYLQNLLKYSPERIGLAFLPTTLVGAALSLGVAAKLATRFGTRRPVVIGLLVASAGMALFARAPLHGDMITDILPGMLLVGLGGGTAGAPMFLIAMQGRAPCESGFVSGTLSTASMMGSALGVASIVSAASAYTNYLLSDGASTAISLIGGYHLAFALGAVLLALAPLIGAVFLPSKGVPE